MKRNGLQVSSHWKKEATSALPEMLEGPPLHRLETPVRMAQPKLACMRRNPSNPWTLRPEPLQPMEGFRIEPQPTSPAHHGAEA